MRVRFCLFVILISALFTCAKITRAQGQEPPDGYTKIFHDEFLNNLAGDWKLTRKIHGQTSQSEVHAEWVLNHQFLLIHMKETSDPSQYEAIVYIGYDNTSERYVAHWIDVGGGRFSERLVMGLAAEIQSSSTLSILTAHSTTHLFGIRRRKAGCH